ncbi:MAG TPA: glutamate 5-kinase, partial [Gammaproteobacteria bacterium]|nr:glutamate 5-kinase [Gammaproteobacteria bacterium]
GQLKPKGQIHLDSGAVAKIANEGKSLLSVGAVEVSGEFQRGDLVECLSPDGRKVASGLVNYGSQDVAKILKLPTTEMLDALGYMGEPELIHRDNLVVV